MRALIYLVLGAVLVAVGLWWLSITGTAFVMLAPLVVIGLGAAFICGALAVALDIYSPTSRKV